MNIFGINFKSKKADEPKSVIPPNNSDGSLVINNTTGTAISGDVYGLTYDPEGSIKSENDLLDRYNSLSQYTEVAEAIENIVNEFVAIDSEEPIKTSFREEEDKLSDGMKKKIESEFKEVLRLLEFNVRGYDIIYRWYVDGKSYFHPIVDEGNLKAGIKEIRYIDPRKMKKVKAIRRTRNDQGIEVVVGTEEYFVYNQSGINSTTASAIRMSTDSVIMGHSGELDIKTGMLVSNLHNAIKPANQLKMLEEAIIIYRWTRAPERRVFYIDVGNLPKSKAEQHMSEMANKFKNKLVLDSQTGEIKDAKRHTSMMEDYWFPRRDGNKTTEVQTLPGGQGLGTLDDLQYFREKLYHSLNVPMSRMKPDQSTFSIGRSNEITRDELKFNRFIFKLRARFSKILYGLLRIQLISKGIIKESEWAAIEKVLVFEYSKDNYFSELKEAEMINNRLAMLQVATQFEGKYFDRQWCMKNILQWDEDESKEMLKRADDYAKQIQALAPTEPTE